MSDWQDIGALDDVPPLGSRLIRTGNGDIAVFRTALDQVFALRDRCPHRGGPLSQGIVHGKRVTCPLHNWIVELSSGEAVAPDAGRTRCFPIKQENGRLFIRLNGGPRVQADCA